MSEVKIMIEAIHKETKEKMKKGIVALESGFGTIRTGRASTSLLDNVTVDAYGSEMPLKQVSNLSIPDPKTILITPWDKNLMSPIEKAILAANLGFTPNNDGKVIRINIPALTEERRKEYVKMAKQKAEDARVSVRNIRRQAIEDIKKLEKDKNITEDDLHNAQEEIQKYTDDFIAQINKSLEKKEKEIMSV